MEAKYAIITGAASGMGRIYAFELAAKGYGLVVVDYNAAALEKLCAELGELHPQTALIPICQDLSAPDAADRVMALVHEAGILVEILINNAGMIVTKTIENTDPERLKAMISLHCTTPLLLCRAVAGDMKNQGGGYILNISSICAWMPWPIIGMYGNTKRFVKGYSRSLRVELRGSGVSVTTAIFGAVDTPLFGFPDNVRKWGVRLGVMITPTRAVKSALNAMFHRRKQVIPSLVNWIIIPVVSIIPDGVLALLVKRFGHLFSAR